MENFQIYRDIQARTGGDIYIGVVEMCIRDRYISRYNIIKIWMKIYQEKRSIKVMSSKITIIGAGSVGSTIAYTLSSQDIASEIVLIDINKQKARCV